jgi:signal transduction histidine kinase
MYAGLTQMLLDQLPLGICVVDREFKVEAWSYFFADRTGMPASAVVGQDLLALFPAQAPLLRKKINAVFLLQNASFSSWEHQPHLFEFSSSRPITGEETLMYQDLQFLPVEHEGTIVSVCLVLQDVTALASYIQAERSLKAELEAEHSALSTLNQKLEAAQNQLLQSEKMAAIGQLAAGVAHEINNPIGFISSNLQSLQDYSHKLLQLTDFYEKVVQKVASEKLYQVQRQKWQQLQYEFIKADLPELLSETCEGVERVAVIVRNLKSFSHVDDSDWQYANLITGLENTIKIANNQLKYKVQLHRDYQADLPELYCQPMQLNQVFLNLLVNAAQAIEEKGDIYLSVSADDTEIRLAFRDTGCGIAPENLKRLFEPFFTTKPVGSGTGLGLSLSWSIVQKHQGRIEVSSTPGVGTTFTVILPFKAPADIGSA